MKPVFQNKHGTDDGNCFEACVASILEIPLESVPPFVLNNPEDWWDKAVLWLASREYSGVWLPNDGNHIPKGFHIAGCDRQMTPHGEIGHVVVTDDGKPIHCPTHGNHPRIPDGIKEWFLIIPHGWPLAFVP
jgi:hypothetical protein